MLLDALTEPASAETVESPEIMNEIGELATCDLGRRQYPALQLGIGDLQKPLEAGQCLALEPVEMRVRVAPDQPVHFLGAAMRRPVGGPAAAGFEVQGH